MAALRSKAAQRFARRFVKGPIAYAKAPAFVLIDGPRNKQSSTAIRASMDRDEVLLRSSPI